MLQCWMFWLVLLVQLLCSSMGFHFDPNPTSQRTVASTSAFQQALLDASVSVINLAADISLSPPPSSAYEIDRHLLIRPAEGLSVIPTLNLKQTPAIFVLSNNSTLHIQGLILTGLYPTTVDRNLLTFNNISYGFVLFEDVIIRRLACLPYDQTAQQLQQQARPAALPGTQSVNRTDPGLCLKGDEQQGGQLADECYTSGLALTDYAELLNSASPDGVLVLQYDNALLVCDIVVTTQCVVQPNEEQLLCILQLLASKRSLPPSPSPPSPQPPVIVKVNSSQSLKEVVVPTVAASVGLILLLVLVGYLYVRRKLREQVAAVALLQPQLSLHSLHSLRSVEVLDSGAVSKRNSLWSTPRTTPRHQYVSDTAHASNVSGSRLGSRPFSTTSRSSAVSRALSETLVDPSCSVSLSYVLGSGSFGKVYYGSWQGQAVAVKIIPHSEQASERVKTEVELCLNFNHPNVVSCLHYECMETAAAADTSGQEPSPDAAPDMETWLVLEYCDSGSLSMKLREGLSHTGMHRMRFMLFVARDIAAGMRYLHSLNICHGDLKCENVLLHNQGQKDGREELIAKVADFGLSRTLGEATSHMSTATVGTVTHMPPELLLSGQLSPSCDVYSFGILLWQLATGQAPFQGMRYAEVVYKVAVSNLRPVFPYRVPSTYVALAEECWDVNPSNRPSFEDIECRIKGMLDCIDALQLEWDTRLQLETTACLPSSSTLPPVVDAATEQAASVWAAAAATALVDVQQSEITPVQPDVSSSLPTGQSLRPLPQSDSAYDNPIFDQPMDEV